LTAYSAYAGRRVRLGTVAVPRTLIRIETAPSSSVVRRVGKWPLAPQADKGGRIGAAILGIILLGVGIWLYEWAPLVSSVNITGTWDIGPNKHSIIQVGDKVFTDDNTGRGRFINKTEFAVSWTDGSGVVGEVGDDKIIWKNGTTWTRHHEK